MHFTFEYKVYLEWDELKDVSVDIFETYELLGYDRFTWTFLIPVYLDTLYWDYLPLEARQAAMDHLCYTRELWDGASLSSWPVNPRDAWLPGMKVLPFPSFCWKRVPTSMRPT